MTDKGPVSNILSTSSINGFGGNFRVPFLPVDSIYTPASYRTDLRLSKILPLHSANENLKLYLNLEIFNVRQLRGPRPQ